MNLFKYQLDAFLITCPQLGNAAANAKRIQYAMAYLAPLPHMIVVVRLDMKCRVITVWESTTATQSTAAATRTVSTMDRAPRTVIAIPATLSQTATAYRSTAV